MKDLSTTKGTIAYALTQNLDSLFQAINQGVCTKDLHSAVCKILDNDTSLKTGDVANAKNILFKHLNNKNLYCSTLMTYMTGLKVGS